MPRVYWRLPAFIFLQVIRVCRFWCSEIGRFFIHHLIANFFRLLIFVNWWCLQWNKKFWFLQYLWSYELKLCSLFLMFLLHYLFRIISLWFETFSKTLLFVAEPSSHFCSIHPTLEYVIKLLDIWYNFSNMIKQNIKH